MAPRTRPSREPSTRKRSNGRVPRILSSSSSSPSPNLNAQYRDLMRTAQSENRDAFNDTYTFTKRGSQKVASKARKFMKAALLVGGVAALGYYFKGPIGRTTQPLFEALGRHYNAAKGSMGNKIKAAKINAKTNKPGYAGRTIQAWNSASRGVGAAHSHIRSKYAAWKPWSKTTMSPPIAIKNTPISHTNNAVKKNMTHTLRHVVRPGPMTHEEYLDEYLEEYLKEKLPRSRT